MGRQTTAILDQLANTIVSIKQQCFATAVARFQLEVQNADRVVIKGLTAVNTGSITGTKCEKSSAVDVRTALGNTLDRIVQASDQLRGQKTEFIAKVTTTLSVDVVETCYAAAESAVELIVKNVQGTVTFENVSVRTTATSAIVSCIQTARVDVNTDLQQFLQLNESWMDKPDVAPVRAQVFLCPHAARLEDIWAATGVLLAIVVLVLVFKRK